MTDRVGENNGGKNIVSSRATTASVPVPVPEGELIEKKRNSAEKSGGNIEAGNELKLDTPSTAASQTVPATATTVSVPVPVPVGELIERELNSLKESGSNIEAGKKLSIITPSTVSIQTVPSRATTASVPVPVPEGELIEKKLNFPKESGSNIEAGKKSSIITPSTATSQTVPSTATTASVPVPVPVGELIERELNSVKESSTKIEAGKKSSIITSSTVSSQTVPSKATTVSVPVPMPEGEPIEKKLNSPKESSSNIEARKKLSVITPSTVPSQAVSSKATTASVLVPMPEGELFEIEFISPKESSSSIEAGNKLKLNNPSTISRNIVVDDGDASGDGNISNIIKKSLSIAKTAAAAAAKTAAVVAAAAAKRSRSKTITDSIMYTNNYNKTMNNKNQRIEMIREEKLTNINDIQRNNRTTIEALAWSRSQPRPQSFYNKMSNTALSILNHASASSSTGSKVSALRILNQASTSSRAASKASALSILNHASTSSSTASKASEISTKTTTKFKSFFVVDDLELLSRSPFYEPIREGNNKLIEVVCKGSKTVAICFGSVLDASQALRIPKYVVRQACQLNDESFPMRRSRDHALQKKFDSLPYSLRYTETSNAYQYGSHVKDFLGSKESGKAIIIEPDVGKTGKMGNEVAKATVSSLSTYKIMKQKKVDIIESKISKFAHKFLAENKNSSGISCNKKSGEINKIKSIDLATLKPPIPTELTTMKLPIPAKLTTTKPPILTELTIMKTPIPTKLTAMKPAIPDKLTAVKTPISTKLTPMTPPIPLNKSFNSSGQPVTLKGKESATEATKLQQISTNNEFLCLQKMRTEQKIANKDIAFGTAKTAEQQKHNTLKIIDQSKTNNNLSSKGSLMATILSKSITNKNSITNGEKRYYNRQDGQKQQQTQAFNASLAASAASSKIIYKHHIGQEQQTPTNQEGTGQFKNLKTSEGGSDPTLAWLRKQMLSSNKASPTPGKNQLQNNKSTTIAAKIKPIVVTKETWLPSPKVTSALINLTDKSNKKRNLPSTSATDHTSKKGRTYIIDSNVRMKFDVGVLLPLTRTMKEEFKSPSKVIELICKTAKKTMVCFNSISDASVALNIPIADVIKALDMPGYEFTNFRLRYVKNSIIYQYGSYEADFLNLKETHHQRVLRWQKLMLVRWNRENKESKNQLQRQKQQQASQKSNNKKNRETLQQEELHRANQRMKLLKLERQQLMQIKKNNELQKLQKQHSKHLNTKQNTELQKLPKQHSKHLNTKQITQLQKSQHKQQSKHQSIDQNALQKLQKQKQKQQSKHQSIIQNTLLQKLQEQIQLSANQSKKIQQKQKQDQSKPQSAKQNKQPQQSTHDSAKDGTQLQPSTQHSAKKNTIDSTSTIQISTRGQKKSINLSKEKLETPEKTAKNVVIIDDEENDICFIDAEESNICEPTQNKIDIVRVSDVINIKKRKLPYSEFQNQDDHGIYYGEMDIRDELPYEYRGDFCATFADSINVCIICQEKPIQVVFEPCHHSVVCKDCATVSFKRFCPQCKVKITKRITPKIVQLCRPWAGAYHSLLSNQNYLNE